MRIYQTARALFFMVLAVSLCCGCSGGGVVIPSIDEKGDPYDFQVDRFGVSTDTPSFSPYPQYSVPQFDRELFGWIIDFNDQLNFDSLVCIVDEKIDLSDQLQLDFTELSAGCLKCDWRCEVPQELLDFNAHRVEMQVTGNDGIVRSFRGMPVFKPIQPPGIDFLVYPYRNILLPSWKQDPPDPNRIFIAVSGEIRDEWADSYDELLSAWSVDGVKAPVDVKFKPESMIAVLTLPEPLTNDTILRFGPVELEEGIIAQDSEPIIVYGSGGKDGDCNCGGYITDSNFDWYAFNETESNAWAYEFDAPDGSCIVHIISFLHHMEIDEDKSPFQYPFEIEDTEPFTTLDLVGTGGSPANGIHTRRYSNDTRHWITWELAAYPDNDPTQPSCWNGDLSTSFTVADINPEGNPMFVDGYPRVVTGPEAADWLEEQSNSDGAHPNVLVPVQIINMRDDLCGLYVLLAVEDSDPGAVAGITMDFVDYMGNPVYGWGNALGPQIWIDNPPFHNEEYEKWDDDNYQDHVPGVPYFPTGYIATDYCWPHEELVMAHSLDDYLKIGVQDLRFRVTDMNGNWTRSENMVDNLPDGLYEVTEVGIIGHDYCGNQVLTDFCETPVHSQGVLDYAACVLINQYLPQDAWPEYIWSKVSAPTHEGTIGLDEINVALYHVEISTSIYSRYYQLANLFNVSGPYNCNIHFYSRKYDIDIPPDADNCPFVVVGDNQESEQWLHYEYEEGEIPYLFISDVDDPALVDQEKDFSISSCGYSESDELEAVATWSKYGPAIQYLNYGYRRGAFIPFCQEFEEDDKQNFVCDIRDKCGVELLEVDVEDHQATVAIQSRGDILFMFAHGACYQAGDPYDRLGRFADWVNPQGGDCEIDYPVWILATEISNPASGFYTEVDWLVTDACHILEPASYSCWQALCPSPLLAVTGWTAHNYCEQYPDYHSQTEPDGPSNFFSMLSAKLNAYNGEPLNEDLWACTPPDDVVIVSWMETACEITRERRPVTCEWDTTNTRWAGAVNANHRYVIDKVRNEANEEDEWKIITDP